MESRRSNAPYWVILATALLLIMVAAGFYWYSHLLPFLKHEVAASQLNEIGQALHGYERERGGLPPPRYTDSELGGVHSWRALMLPYLKSHTAAQVKREYSLAKPWNSDENKKVLHYGPYCNRSKGRDPIYTSYLALLDAEGNWNPGTATGTWVDPVLVVELHESDVLWTEPRDIIFDGDKTFLELADGTRREIDLRGRMAVRRSGLVGVIPQAGDIKPFLLKGPN